MTSPGGSRRRFADRCHTPRKVTTRMSIHLSLFSQRWPPALGGSEAYCHRLARHLATGGDDVTVWTTTALDLEAFWSPAGRTVPAGVADEDGLTIRRHAPTL